MEANLTSHFHKVLAKVLTRSTIATLRKLLNIWGQLLYFMSLRREKKNRRCWSICTIGLGRFLWPENRSGNFFTTRVKIIEGVCTKQNDQLFPCARSYIQQMGEGRYETEVQRMIRSIVKKWIRTSKWIKKYQDHVSFINNETFTCRVVNRLLQWVNFVIRKGNCFRRLESTKNICC